MALKRTELREFAVIGARTRLVMLERERQRIFTEFPELEAAYNRATAPEKPAKAVNGANGHSKKTGLDAPTALVWLQSLDRPFKTADVIEHFGVTKHVAKRVLVDLKKNGLLGMKGHARAAAWNVTAKGKEA